MKILLTFSVLFISLTAISQDWKEHLRDARKAYSKRNYSKAVQDYEKTISIAPKEINLFDELAQAQYKSRNFKAAEKTFQKSLLSVKNKKNTALRYYNIGNSKMKSRDYAGAVDAYKQALRKKPHDKEAQYNLSAAMRRLKMQQKKKNKEDRSQQKNKKQQEESQKNPNNANKNQQQEKNQKNISGVQNEKGSLSQRAVDRMLDKLMKDESATKRKMNKNKQANSGSPVSKDW